MSASAGFTTPASGSAPAGSLGIGGILRGLKAYVKNVLEKPLPGMPLVIGALFIAAAEASRYCTCFA
jgi:hypothetical protein